MRGSPVRPRRIVRQAGCERTRGPHGARRGRRCDRRRHAVRGSAQAVGRRVLGRRRHVLQHGLEPGPHFKALLDAVREAQLEGTITTAEEAIALVFRLRAERKNET